MKSGMIVDLEGYGKTQVIGEIKDGKFIDVWGIGSPNIVKMSPKGELLNQVLKACRDSDNSNIIAQAKLMQSDLENRLELITEAAEKIKGENIDVTV